MGRRRCRVPRARACTLPSRKSHSCRNLEPGVAANARPEAHGFGCPSPLILVLVVLALCSGAQLHAQAQAFNASLTGAVYDHSGAAVAGATVALSNPDKGFTRTFTTGPDGHYTFTLVPAGTYTLKVEMTSFRPYTQNGIVLAVGQVAEQNVTLELGAVTQEITVTASAPLINTSNANISSDVDQRQTVELPLNLRNVFGLVALNSSVNNSQQNQALRRPLWNHRLPLGRTLGRGRRLGRHRLCSSG